MRLFASVVCVGFTGLVMLHGLILRGGGPAAWQISSVYANEHPTYYGMLVAGFLKQ